MNERGNGIGCESEIGWRLVVELSVGDDNSTVEEGCNAVGGCNTVDGCIVVVKDCNCETVFRDFSRVKKEGEDEDG